MIIQRISRDDDVDAVCAQLGRERWGSDNDMASYDPESVRRFVADENNLLVVGYEDGQIVCSALCYALRHPDASRSSIYIDEIDTHPDYRRKSFASDMITWLRSCALKNSLTEVWLATEADNNAGANTFYKSLQPSETLVCNLYSYKSEER